MTEAKLNPTTMRGRLWCDFAEAVLEHIEEYTVPQYGDAPDDELSEWTSTECMTAIRKYTRRHGKNSREGQDALDCLKIAHYACAAHVKIEILT